MKLLITGASGLLGTELKKYFESLPQYNLLLPNRQDFDLTNFENVNRFISQNKPDIIIHTAAHTNLEESEKYPELAFKINTIGTLAICRSILETKTKLVYISSSGIYGDHKDTPWHDYDSVEPTTIHHKSKWEAEKLVNSHVPNNLILRTGWLFGGSINNPKNFVYNRYLEAQKQEVIFANPAQFGNPTSAKDLAKQIEILLSNKIIGTFNCVNKNSVNRLDYIRQIYLEFGLSNKVKPVEGKFNRLAKVSDNEMAENYYLDLLGLNCMPSFESSLAEYIITLKEQINA